MAIHKPWQWVLLGLTQGITEFLPVSSTAHLNLIRQKLRQKPDLSVDTALHLGSLAATLLWVLRRRHKLPLQDPHFWGKGALATLPVGLAGVLLEKPLQKWRHPHMSAAMLIAGGLGLLLTDSLRPPRQTPLAHLSYAQAMGIGGAQSLALIPGLSRSGMTQMAGQWQGLSGEDAQHFSFLLAIPVVTASALFEMRHLSARDRQQMQPGILSAGLSSYLMLEQVNYFASGKPYRALAYYRVALGAYLLKKARKDKNRR